MIADYRNHKLRAIKNRHDVKDVLDRPLRRGSKRMANILLSDLKQFFGYADDEELITGDTARRMNKSRVGGIEKSRERYLNEEERKLLLSALPTSGLPQNYQHALCILLATYCRVDELSKAEWGHDHAGAWHLASYHQEIPKPET